MTSRVVLATRNAGKVREMQSLLAPLGWTVLNQADLGIPSAPEDGLTFLENALAKARHACLLSGLPAIADDSGLVVDALGGAPGIQSARFAGENADDDANNRHLLQALGSGSSRRAHFYCVLVYLEHARHPAPTVAVGRWSGHLRTTPAGSGGFGYDPLFQPDGLTCTSAELTATEKNTLSHRGQACRMLLDMLEKR
ncbi:MAG: RdgB/HAM1 family non-canonical purine NTP pyrophosphatase [Pseudomonadales bacterium]